MNMITFFAPTTYELGKRFYEHVETYQAKYGKRPPKGFSAYDTLDNVYGVSRRTMYEYIMHYKRGIKNRYPNHSSHGIKNAAFSTGNIYLLLQKETNHLKIGWTRYDDYRRMKDMAMNPFNPSIIAFVPAMLGKGTETYLHKECAEHHYNREWFHWNSEIKSILESNLGITLQATQPMVTP